DPAGLADGSPDVTGLVADLTDRGERPVTTAEDPWERLHEDHVERALDLDGDAAGGGHAVAGHGTSLGVGVATDRAQEPTASSPGAALREVRRRTRSAASASRAMTESASDRPDVQTPVESRSMVRMLRRAAGLET